MWDLISIRFLCVQGFHFRKDNIALQKLNLLTFYSIALMCLFLWTKTLLLNALLIYKLLVALKLLLKANCWWRLPDFTKKITYFDTFVDIFLIGNRLEFAFKKFISLYEYSKLNSSEQALWKAGERRVWEAASSSPSAQPFVVYCGAQARRIKTERVRQSF